MMVFQTTKQKLSKKILIALSVVTLSHFIFVFIQAVFLRDYFTQYWKSTRDYRRPD